MLNTELVWKAFTLLLDQLEGVNVAEISERDFNEAGELIMSPPSVRSFFTGEKASSLSDTQRLSYNVTGVYVALCASEDLRGSVDQAKASLRLASRVKTIMAGARLALPDGDITEPVTFISMHPEPLDDVGVAYAVTFEVPGIAQFPGANAWPSGGEV